MTHWTEQFIGLPWKVGGRELTTGLDCWGLLMHVYRTLYGIELNTYTGLASDNADNVFTLQHLELDVASHWLPTDAPQDGDVVALGRTATPHHVGLYVEGEAVLHAGRGAGSRIEPLQRLKQNGLPVARFYHHAGRL